MDTLQYLIIIIIIVRVSFIRFTVHVSNFTEKFHKIVFSIYLNVLRNKRRKHSGLI